MSTNAKQPPALSLAEASLQELLTAARQLHAFSSATLAALLGVIAECDRTEAWKAEGATSTAAWLVGAMGVSSSAASELVRVARALAELPEIAAEAAEGKLCWDQLRAITRFATPETDAALAAEAPGRTAYQLERAARQELGVNREEVAEADAQRALWWSWDDRRQQLMIRGKIPAAEGAVFTKAIERIADGMSMDLSTGLPRPYAARCADALVELASQRLSEDTDSDRARVVIHVDASALAGDQGGAELEDGTQLSIDVARRLSCDALIEVVAEGADGSPLGVGRTGRTLPPRLYRALKHRDGGRCTFPGCGRKRWVQGHHIEAWADGGRTDLDNLALVCGYHHRLVHEHEWIVRIIGGEVRFFSKEGQRLPPDPRGR